MEKRLLLSRRLLKKDAVMVVTIDEHEVTRLGVLLSQLFPDADVTLVTIVINPKGVTRPGVRRFSRVEEYAYFCFFGSAGLDSWGDDLLTLGAGDIEKEAAAEGEQKRPRWKGLLRSGTNAKRKDREKLFYPVLVDPEKGAVVRAGKFVPLDKSPNLTRKVEGLTPVWPIRRDKTLGNWGVGPKTLQTLIDKGYVALGKYDEKRKTWALSYLSKEPQEQIASGILEVVSRDKKRNVVDVVYADPDSAGRRIKTVWHRTTHDAGVGGTDVVSALLNGRNFTFPKSVYAVRDTIEMLTKSNKEALILDYFGGSGTTAHATMMLNAEDGGRRRCILITNNEVEVDQQETLRSAGIKPGDAEWEKNGIFYRATKPRIEAVITGKRADKSKVPDSARNADGSQMNTGVQENVEMLELVYLDRNDVSRGAAFAAIAPLLWMRAGATGEMVAKQELPYVVRATSSYAVLFDIRAWTEFCAKVRTQPSLRHVYIVTDSVAQFQQIVAELPVDCPVTMLYEDYLRNFEINTGGVK